MKKLYTLAALLLGFMLASPASVFAQDIVEGLGIIVSEESFCISGLGSIGGIAVGILGAVVVVASTLANMVGKSGFLGKLVHFLALNVTVDKAKK